MPYEPGSTMKVFTYAAAIDSGAYDGSVLVDSSKFCYAAANRKPYRVSQGDSRKIGCIGNASGKSWGMIPVSYTHLDVYKRQFLLSFPLSNVFQPAKNPGVKPVSYTHLDVYKRQW